MPLNTEQENLVTAKPGSQMLIRGVAGSGKTTVALHRALFLQLKHCSPDESVLIAAYNKSFINYLDYIYKIIADEHARSYFNLYSGKNSKLMKSTVDKLISDYYKANRNDKELEITYDRYKAVGKIFKDCISEVKKDFSGANIIDHKYNQFLFDEIDWIKACDYMDLKEYQQVDRVGRARPESGSNPQRLAKNSKERQAIFELMKLFDRRMRSKGYIYYRDMALEALNHARANPPRTYKHIIIDEGQDLSRVQLEFIRTLYRNDADSSFTFVADRAQNIYTHGWLVGNRSFASIGFDMTGKSFNLTRNYRTSTQVAQAAYSMIVKDGNIVGCEDYVKPELVDRQGQYPVLRPYDTERSESLGVLERIIKLLEQGYAYKDITVIAREKKRLESLQEFLKEKKIPCKTYRVSDSAFDKNRVQLLTMHAIKGLEYKVVFMITLNDGVIPYAADSFKDSAVMQESYERKLFYVGMSRAREQLFMSYFGKPSKFVLDITAEYIRTDPDKRIKSFYQVPVDDYLHRDKVRNIYGREEAVRQWVARELIHTYKYKENMIVFERKIGIGSKGLSLDIAVMANHNGTLAPTIIIETKAPGSDFADGFEQLKSYMERVPTCEYGVLTDGNYFSVFNRDFEPVDDLPFFIQSMRSYDGDKYVFTYLGSDNEHILKIDYTDDSYVAVETGREVTEFKGRDVVTLPVFERVAAGSAQLMNEQVVDYFSLPAKWVGGKDKYFLLKVKGDSMIGAGIDDGDRVLVRKQDQPQNNDIVIVSLGDEAVIKRYSNTGPTVTLQSENIKYPPISIRTELARILGVAIAVIRGK